MNTNDFDYYLPESLIAQTPLLDRTSSRLLYMNKKSCDIEHKHFYNIIDYLNEGDCLILNDSRVLPARLYGAKEDTGAKIEILILNQREPDVWEILAKPGRKAQPGTILTFGDGLLKSEILSVLDDGNRLAKFHYEGNFYEVLDKIGQMPLPHYIKETLKDKERYQTVYSRELGSAAAPTAGLHFTPELLEKIKQKGVNIAFVTLHVGLGTFRPVKVDDVSQHKMHSEHYEISDETAKLINNTKANGKRVIAVGTTSCRTLESVYKKHGKITADEGFTDIFIYPGYKWNVVDALITNFHLPKSTLIMLVASFAGFDNTMKAYQEAVKEEYRFFSFGDAMFIA